MDQKSGLVRTIFIAMSGVSVIGIFLSMERAAWLAGALILVGLFWLYPKIMLRFLIISAVLLLFLGELFFSKYASRVADRINNQGTIYDRIVVTDAMFQMIQVKPIFGWGYDSLNNHIENYYRQVGDASGNIRFTTSHNTYLTIFTELGLVGFLLYMLPMLWLLVMSFRVWRGILKIEPTRRFMLATLWLATLNIFVISNFIDMRFFPIGLTLWWLNLGLIANILNRQHEIYDKFSTKISWQAHDETISHDNLGLVNG
jgi:O-antigen ligase